MRFILLDRITALQPGESIEAVKALSLAEEYLQDHFPRFPVMPGVLMLEAMFQTSAWLVRHTDQFVHAGVRLKESRNVKFADFVEPGQLLCVRAEISKQADQLTTLKTQGVVDGKVAVSGRLVLERFHLADCYPHHAATDPYARRRMRDTFEQLYQPTQSLESVG